MPCNCGGGSTTKKVVYIARFPDGTTQTYASEVEARTAVVKRGGTYQASVKR